MDLNQRAKLMTALRRCIGIEGEDREGQNCPGCPYDGICSGGWHALDRDILDFLEGLKEYDLAEAVEALRGSIAKFDSATM